MNKKTLIHSAIISSIAFISFFLFRYWFPDAIFEIKISFMLLAAVSGVVNCARWEGVYGRSHPHENAWRPHFAQDSPDANALCFNALKWAGFMFLFVLL